ncbi:hypothetical protein BHE90_012420 [Fusarium euwallaceae]|uniref:Uncharacterized protein n=1 Tax=Fusarium euwallaceae TaxID=1147111 RepID=A0A430LBQ1_9HYPO|nr:hypothetical protein BHE90_012420 [Fusarium euwallaceae]
MAGSMDEGSAEFLSHLIKGRAVSCPHYPKYPKKKDPLTSGILTEGDPIFPSRLGFFHHSQSEPRVSYLETNKVCLECLCQAVPNGYNFWSMTVDAKDEPSPSSPWPLEVAPLSAVDSVLLVQAGTEGFYPDSSTSLPGATPIMVPIPDVPRAKEAWQWLQDERKPFYIDQLHHSKGRKLTISGKKAVKSDASIVSNHGVSFDQLLLVKAAAEQAFCRRKRVEASASKSSKSSSTTGTLQSHQSHWMASVPSSQASDSTTYSKQGSASNVFSMSLGEPSPPTSVDFDLTTSLVEVSEKQKKSSKKANFIQPVQASPSSVSQSETANSSNFDPDTEDKVVFLSTRLKRSGASRKKCVSTSTTNPVEVSAISVCHVQSGKEGPGLKLKKATSPLKQSSSSPLTLLNDPIKAEDLAENSTKSQISTERTDSKKNKDSSRVKRSTKAKAPKLKDTQVSSAFGSAKVDAAFVISKDHTDAESTKPEPPPLQETSFSPTTVALASTSKLQPASATEALGIAGQTKSTQYSTSVGHLASVQIAGQDTRESGGLSPTPTSSFPKTPKSLLLFENLIQNKSQPNAPKFSKRPVYTRNCYWSQHAPIDFVTEVSSELYVEAKKHRNKRKSRDKVVLDSSDSEDETSKREKKSKKRDKRERKEKGVKAGKKDPSATKTEKKTKGDKTTKEEKRSARATFTGGHESTPIKAEKSSKPHVDHGTAATSKSPKSSSKTSHLNEAKGGSGGSSKKRDFNVGFHHESKSSKNKQSSKNWNHAKDSKKRRKPSAGMDATVNAPGPEQSAPTEEPQDTESSSEEDTSSPSSGTESQSENEDPEDWQEANYEEQEIGSEMPDKDSPAINEKVKPELNTGLDTPVPSQGHDTPSWTPECHNLSNIPDKSNSSPTNLGSGTEQPKPDATDASAAIGAKTKVDSGVDVKEAGNLAPTKESSRSDVPGKDLSPPDASTKGERAEPEIENARKPAGEPKSGPLPPLPCTGDAPVKADKPRVIAPPTPEPTNINPPSAPIPAGLVPSAPVSPPPSAGDSTRGQDTRPSAEGQTPVFALQISVASPPTTSDLVSGEVSQDRKENPSQLTPTPSDSSSSEEEHEPEEPGIQRAVEGPRSNSDSDSESETDHESGASSPSLDRHVLKRMDSSNDGEEEEEELTASPNHWVQAFRHNSVSDTDGDSSEADDYSEATDHHDDASMGDDKSGSTSDEDHLISGSDIDHSSDDEQDFRDSSDMEMEDISNPAESEDKDEEDDNQQSSGDSTSVNDTEEDSDPVTDAESSDNIESSDNDPSDAESESNQSSNSDGDDAQSSSDDESQSEPRSSSEEPSESDRAMSDGGYSS